MQLKREIIWLTKIQIHDVKKVAEMCFVWIIKLDLSVALCKSHDSAVVFKSHPRPEAELPSASAVRPRSRNGAEVVIAAEAPEY